MTKVTYIREVINKRRRQNVREIKQILSADTKSMLATMGEDLAGFALVVWNKDGQSQASYSADVGLVAPALVPTYVADSLNRFLAIKAIKNHDDSDVV